MIKLIIFDFDGVIITGSNEGYFKCYHKALESVGVSLTAEEERKRILAWWGKGYKLQLELLLKDHKELLPEAIRVYEGCYYSSLFTQNIKLVKGAKSSLLKLSKVASLAIASGMARKTMESLIKKFEINYFKEIVTTDDIEDVKDRKPSPFMLNKILKALSVSQEETIYVGDAQTDVVMAKCAKITPVVVLTGHLTTQEAKELGVDYVLPDITYLKKLIAQV